MTLDPACVFCRIVAGQAEASLVFRDDSVTVFMDTYPLTPGHVLIVPNHHVPDLRSLDDASGSSMMAVARWMAQAMRVSGLRCQGVNLLLADGAAAGQSVFHVHLHVIPRFESDGFGFRRRPRLGGPPGRQELHQVAEQLRAALKAVE